jgi:shikimate kinase
MELVGPAGSGKTTLLRALSARDNKIRVTSDLEIRDRGHMPIFIGHAPYLLSLFRRGFSWDEMKAMVYLDVWPAMLKPQPRQRETAILLNHGPIFKLATLNAFGPDSLKSRRFEYWWPKVCEQWACTLDMIVWLNAPDRTLMERINARNQRHAVKGKSAQEATDYLIRYRTSYEQMLANLTTHGGPTLLQFDTSRTSVDQIVDEVLLACYLKLRGN